MLKSIPDDNGISKDLMYRLKPTMYMPAMTRPAIVAAKIFFFFCEKTSHELQIFEPRQFLVSPCVLGKITYQLPNLVRLFQHIVAEDLNFSFVWFQQSRDDPERGGLSGAVGSNEPEYLSLFDLKSYTLERLYGAEPFLEPFNRNDQIENPLGAIMMDRNFFEVNLYFHFDSARCGVYNIDRKVW
jgi:hypothetical protein